MSKNTDYFLKVLQVISWFIFVGVCIEASGFIVNTIGTLILKPDAAARLWTQVNLSELYHYNQSHYITVTSLMIIVALLRVVMFYLIVRFFYKKILSLSNPFNESVKQFISLLAYISLGIGLFSSWGSKLTEDLRLQGIKIPDIQYLRMGGADVWLFMGIVLLVIVQIFKKGIELQNENDLTV